MMKNKADSPLFRLHRLHLCPPFMTFEKLVVFQLKSPPPCQTITPLQPPRLHRLCMCSPLVQLVKFVVFQVLVRFYSIEKV